MAIPEEVNMQTVLVLVAVVVMDQGPRAVGAGGAEFTTRRLSVARSRGRRCVQALRPGGRLLKTGQRPRYQGPWHVIED